MRMQPVIFSAPKEHYRPAEWEDGGGWDTGQGESTARFAVADGATLGYDSRRWVRQLLDSFLAAGNPDMPPGPALDRDSLGGWLARMQECWSLSVTPAIDSIGLQKIREGTLATFVGCQLDGLDGRSARWQAVAAGDAVLFHVRAGRLVSHLPPLSAADFGTTPGGLHTRPDRLDTDVPQLQFGSGDLLPGDLLFAATDAFAQWMLAWVDKDEAALWRSLAALAHPADFDHLVSEQRTTKVKVGKHRVEAAMDDDITLLRVRLLPQAARRLVIWR